MNTRASLTYVEPPPSPRGSAADRVVQRLKSAWPFLLVVAAPTLVAAIYFLLIASPRYVSEAQFVVRAPNASQQPSALGVALQGVGIQTAQGDAFAVHEYIRSRDALNELQRSFDVADMLGRRGADPFSRYPRPWEGRSEEGLYEGLQRFVVVGYDSTTGISTLRVEAFSAADAQKIAEGLLQGGERLVNRMNVRAARDTLLHARNAQETARQKSAEAQAALRNFRNQENFLDPELSAKESADVIVNLRRAVADLQAQREQIAAGAPSSPQLSALDARIKAYNDQIASERAKVANQSGGGSLASKSAIYQQLTLRQELADKELAQATATLISAEQDAQRQKLYLERIVNPNAPDESTQPKRLLSILAVFASMMVVYGIGWLAWAGLREHAQG